MKNHWYALQLFAEGNGGEAADTGETGAAAGHQQLLELGVPADKLRNRAKDTPRAAAGESRMTWEQVKADPEFSGRMQEMVKQRLKDAGQAKEAMTTLEPVLRTLAAGYGLDPEAPDYGALAKAVAADRRFAPRQSGDTALRRHYQLLTQQGESMKEQYPGFDLQRELKNPAFVRLTAPGVGVSVEEAYCAIHSRQLREAAAAASVQQISNAIRAGAMRPEENGTVTAPAVTAFDYKNASAQQREALRRAIRAAGARGEKIYPGQEKTI